MDQSKKNRNYHSQQQQQQQQQQASQQNQQQQQQQPQQIHGRMKGATRIQSNEQRSLEQDQHLSKPSESSSVPMDATFTTTNGNSQNIHIGAQAVALERCSNDTSNSGNNNSSATLQHLNNQTSNNLLFLGSSGSEIDSSSSSYTVQTNSSMNMTTTLAPQPMIPAAASSTAVTANVIASHQHQNQQHNNHHHHHQQQQQQIQYDSPQIQPYDIKSLFECPICFDYAVPPIYQCQNGHLVCQSCSNKIAHCPTCRVPITEPSIRNLQLDKLANQFQFPCKYNFVGCQWKSYWFKKREHEEICDYISYSCPCPGTSCKWTGLLSQVMPHLSEHHKSITTLSGEDIVFLATDINLKGAVDWVMIQSCFNHHFLLVLEKQELKNGQQQFFAIVQLIGTPKEAEKFKYKLELSSNTAGQAKRLQWEATPRSILDGIQFAIANYDCLVFDSRMAQHFLSPIKRDSNNKPESCTGDSNNTNAGQSENLGINVTIERVM